MNSNLPVFNISNFDGYTNSVEFDHNFYIRNFSEYVAKNSFIKKPHGHDFYLILVITKGSGIHTIDFTEYEVAPNTMFIVSPGQIHQWNVSKDIEGFILFFTKEFFLQDFDSDRLTRFPFFNSTFSLPYFSLNKSETDEIILKYELILKEYKNRSSSYQEMIRMYMNAMFIELSRIHDTKNRLSSKFSYDLLQLNRYKTLVDKYFKNHRPLSCYSKKMNITDRQLGYLCKKTVGKTPSEILNDRIMLEAKRLVMHSELSISAISEELNFNDSSYFIRLFKKITQQTPEQYRNDQYNKQYFSNDHLFPFL